MIFLIPYLIIEDYYKMITSLKKLKCKKIFIEPTQRGSFEEVFITI
jgi:hypothetical protein